MDYHEYKANCVQQFVAATYKITVHYAMKIAEHIIEKLKAEDPEEVKSEE